MSTLATPQADTPVPPKVDPDTLGDSVVVYTDSTIAAPLMTAYALARVKRRKPRRLYDRREALVEKVKIDFLAEHERRSRKKK